MVECLVWDQDAAGSSPVISTIEDADSKKFHIEIVECVLFLDTSSNQKIDDGFINKNVSS